MRTISAGGLAKLAQQYGTEPITIVEVDWAGVPISYADRDVSGINGRIIDVSDMDNVVDVLSSNNSQAITVTLIDTDGSIKGILDTNDVHQRNVRVYQHFDGLALSDKFLLFQGKLSSPIVWSEGSRTVTFTVISQLEDKEFGFSAEEGQFPFLPKDMVGKAWPVIFGRVLDVPALQINKAVSGSTLCGIGVISGEDLHNQIPLGGDNCSLGLSLSLMNIEADFLRDCSAAWAEGAEDMTGQDQLDAQEKSAALEEQANQLHAAVQAALIQRSEQLLCAQTIRANTVDGEGTLGCNPVRILGGEDFPQDTPIVLNINGGLFTGRMIDDSFTIMSREHPENDDRSQSLFDSADERLCEQNEPTSTYFDFRMDVPEGTGDFTSSGQTEIVRIGLITCTTHVTSRPSVSQVAQHFWAEPGSRVVMSSDEPITYIVSITPGEVLAVKAFKTFNGERKLVNVPNDLYTIGSVTYGPIMAVTVVVNKPLSTIVDQGWDDDLYVTFESEIGPNIVDILEHIIETYTDLDFDTASFSSVKTLLDPFPANFPVLDRRNTIDLIKDIAFQARCAVWINNGVFHLKYLPVEPASDSTITVSDIEHKSVEVELTPTEDLVTKMVVKWRLSWADDEPLQFILRHNVDRYGTKEEEFDFFIYNQPDIALKAATFWLIRKSKTWKKIRFKTFLQKLALETFDTVTLDLPGHVATGTIKAIVERAVYNSNDQLIDFECWVPVIAGTMTKYKFAWPSALTVTDTFPTPEEIADGSAGGAGIGAGATGELPIGFTDGLGAGGTVFVGGPNVLFRAQSDRGDRTPTDAGFVAQTIIPDTVFAEVDNTPNPAPDLTLNYIDPIPPPVRPSSPSSGGGGDVSTSLLETFFFIEGGVLKMRTDAIVKDEAGEDGTEAPFHFEYDSGTNQYGAGTAFLQD